MPPALRARRLNPEVRLVIRMFNRTLGGYLESLLDRAAQVASPELDDAALEASTTVLSDSDTAAPSLVAAAIVGSEKVVYADGLLLRAKERTLGTAARHNALCTLALTPGSDDSDEGAAEDGDGDRDAEGAGTGTGAGAGRGRSQRAGGPVLLPDDASLEGLPAQRGAVVLEAITHSSGPRPPRPPRLPRMLAFKELFSRKLRYSLLALTAVVVALAAFNWVISGDSPAHAAYVTLLDVFGINDPKTDEPADEQLLQILAGFAGMMLLPLFMAIVLESYGAFRKATALPDPPRGLAGHVVLLGLGKVGWGHLPAVAGGGCWKSSWSTRSPSSASSGTSRRAASRWPAMGAPPSGSWGRVPTLIADVTERGVLEDARIKRARALLALTSSDGTNLEASLYARRLKPEVRVAMRLFDDEFATTVYRTLRDTYPAAQTRSRSVSALAAPAFARVDVAGNPLLEGRTVSEAFRAGAWRALSRASQLGDEAAGPGGPAGPGTAGPGPAAGEPLAAGEQVVIAATRRGLGELLAESPGELAGTTVPRPA